MAWLRDAAEWVLAAAAYRAVLWLPTGGRLYWKLLPTAGLYAHTYGGLAEYRRERTGFLTCALPRPSQDGRG